MCACRRRRFWRRVPTSTLQTTLAEFEQRSLVPPDTAVNVQAGVPLDVSRVSVSCSVAECDSALSLVSSKLFEHSADAHVRPTLPLELPRTCSSTARWYRYPPWHCGCAARRRVPRAARCLQAQHCMELCRGVVASKASQAHAQKRTGRSTPHRGAPDNAAETLCLMPWLALKLV